MMKAAIRRGAAVVLLVLVTACTTVAPAVPTAPTASNSESGSTRAPAPVVPPGFPAVSRPARLYVAAPPFQMASRYVLYDDGSFALQYASANYPFFEYRGTYKEAGDIIRFVWEDCCAWDATGLLDGDSLSVSYSDRMQHSDFLDGVYVRTP